MRLLLLVGTLCLLAASEAATIGQQRTRPAIGEKPDSDKDRSGQVVHRAFNGAGQRAGVETWRIEKFEPVAQNDQGKFHTGDSYIVLSTKEVGGQKTWDIFFWLGTETSQDESGAAAIYTVQLDKKLADKAVQHREVQGFETDTFKSLFKGGPKYLPGGVATGLRHVDNKSRKRLYLVKGKKDVRIKEVEISAASINRGDSYVLDAGNDIFVFQGSKSSRIEKLKAVSAANQVRDVDHSGRGKVTVFDDASSVDEMNQFFDVLGTGKSTQILDESVGGDDAAFEKLQDSTVFLHKVTESGGSVRVDKLTQKPFKQQQLDTTDCFILETEQSNIYVWIGKKSSQKEKEEAMKKAEEMRKNKKLPVWAKVERIIEGTEPSAFRFKFPSWQGYGESHPRIVRSLSKCQSGFDPTLWQIYNVRDQRAYREVPIKAKRLESDKVMILETGCLDYIWVGKDYDDMHELLEYLSFKEDGPGRLSAFDHKSFMIIREGEEPIEFKKNFPIWYRTYSGENKLTNYITQY